MHPKQFASNVDGYHLNAIFAKALPKLIGSRPRETLALLAKQLESAITKEVPETLWRHSSVWRASISEVPTYIKTGTTYDVLVSQLHDAMELVIEMHEAESASILGAVTARESNIFKRIFLDVLCSGKLSNIIRSTLEDRTFMGDEGLGVERWMFANKYLDHLETSIRSNIVETLLPPRANDKRQLCRRRDALFTISSYLSESQVYELAELIEHLGDPSNLMILNWPRASTLGPESPFDAHEFTVLPIRQLIKMINAFDPNVASGDFSMPPSPEGIARALRQRSAKSPNEFLKHIAAIKTLEATYIRGIVSGLQDAVRAQSSFDFVATLDLLNWAAVHENTKYMSSGFLTRDADWNWTYQAVAHLILDIVTRCRDALDISFRESVWNTISNLMTVSEPEADDRDDANRSSYSNIALNTVRGIALHAVMEYCRWVYLAIFGDVPVSDDDCLLEKLFPEVAMVLQRGLEEHQDRGPISHAVYGQYFIFLLAIDRNWARSRSKSIFGTDPYESVETRSAWEAYLTFCTPNLRSIEDLECQYTASISRLIAFESNEVPRSQDDLNPVISALDHVFQSFLFGGDRLSYTIALLQRVLDANSPGVMAHLLTYAGGFMRERVEARVIEKLQLYVEARVAVAESSIDAQPFVAELSKLGTWYRHQEVPINWLLDQTIRVLQITSFIDEAFGVIDVLKDVESSHLSKSLTVLELISSNTADPWMLMGSNQTIFQMLERAKLLDPNAIPQIQRIASYMMQRGWPEFEKL